MRPPSHALPAAASSLSSLSSFSALVESVTEPAEVLHVFASGFYLGVRTCEDRISAPGILPVLGPGALRLPTGVFVPRLDATLLSALEPGMVGSVSYSRRGTDGEPCAPAPTNATAPRNATAEAHLRTITVAELDIAVVRRIAPPRICPTPPPRHTDTAVLNEFAAGLQPGLTELPALTASLVSALLGTRGTGPAHAVLGTRGTGSADGLPAIASATSAMLGRGPGSTPSGDDSLCGIALGLRLFGLDDALALLTQTVDGLVPEARTTALSAQLLRAALSGHCLPEIASAISGVRRRIEPAPGATNRPPTPADVTERLSAIGHSSGHDLFTGFLITTARACGL